MGKGRGGKGLKKEGQRKEFSPEMLDYPAAEAPSPEIWLTNPAGQVLNNSVRIPPASRGKGLNDRPPSHLIRLNPLIGCNSPHVRFR